MVLLHIDHGLHLSQQAPFDSDLSSPTSIHRRLCIQHQRWLTPEPKELDRCADVENAWREGCGAPE
jgi:hypothetical protein